jgi:hypothetical protein
MTMGMLQDEGLKTAKKNPVCKVVPHNPTPYNAIEITGRITVQLEWRLTCFWESIPSN